MIVRQLHSHFPDHEWGKNSCHLFGSIQHLLPNFILYHIWRDSKLCSSIVSSFLPSWYCVGTSTHVPYKMMLLCKEFMTSSFIVLDAQPEDFVPYVEYKANLQTYQWIGAGRDSDSHLQPLCQHWLDHRDEMTTRPVKEEEVEEEMGEGIGEERAASPPPPRCPTTWVVRPSTAEEKECFREQVYLPTCCVYCG
jgi:hypothetical protein